MTKRRASELGPTPSWAWVPINVGPGGSVCIFTRIERLTDVERVSLLLWNPVFVDHDQLLDELRQGFSIKGLLFS